MNKSSRRILVFSQNNSDALKMWQKFNGFNGDTYDFISTLKELRAKIKNNDYAKVVIDHNKINPHTIILKAIAIIAKSRIPVTIKNLFNDIPSANKRSLAGISIRRNSQSGSGIPANDLSDDEKRDIVSNTAATLSHEINNPLMTISANAETILKNNGNLSPEVQEKIRLISRSVDRIRDVTEKLTHMDRINLYDTAAGKMVEVDKSVERSRNTASRIPEKVFE